MDYPVSEQATYKQETDMIYGDHTYASQSGAIPLNVTASPQGNGQHASQSGAIALNVTASSLVPQGNGQSASQSGAIPLNVTASPLVPQGNGQCASQSGAIPLNITASPQVPQGNGQSASQRRSIPLNITASPLKPQGDRQQQVRTKNTVIPVNIVTKKVGPDGKLQQCIIQAGLFSSGDGSNPVLKSLSTGAVASVCEPKTEPVAESANRFKCEMCGKIFVRHFQLGVHYAVYHKIKCADKRNKPVVTENNQPMQQEADCQNQAIDSDFENDDNETEQGDNSEYNLLRDDMDEDNSGNLSPDPYHLGSINSWEEVPDEATLVTDDWNVDSIVTLDNTNMYVCWICGLNVEEKKEFIEHGIVEHKTRQPFKCHVCGELYLYPKNLRHHYKSAHDGYVRSCVLCNLEFTDMGVYNTHIHYHHKAKDDYWCSVCRKNFTSSHELSAHKKEHFQKDKEGNDIFQCKLCNKKYFAMAYLTKHIADHYEPNFTCKVCNRPFRCREGYMTHMYRHTGETPYRCDQCEAQFINPNYLKAHKEKHITEEKYACEKCAKKFKTVRSMKLHLRTRHKRDKPGAASEESHLCSQCGKTMKSSQAYHEHMKRHGHQDKDDWPATCERCGKGFNYQCDLTKHMKYHMNNKSMVYQCGVCALEFPSQGRCDAHTKEHGLAKCSRCKDWFQSLEELNNHKQQEHASVKCVRCKQWFPNVEELHIHRKQEHPSVKCSLCKQWFPNVDELNKHRKQTHPGVRCAMCKKWFQNLRELRCHKIQKHADAKSKCHSCKQWFPNLDALRMHKKQMHPRSVSKRKNEAKPLIGNQVFFEDLYFQ